MGVLVKTSLFICILWGIHIWIKQVIDTEENNQKMEETLENMNHSYVEFQGKINQARKYRHDIPKHLHMMEQAVSDIIDDEYSVDTMLNAIACVTEEKCLEYNIQIKINLAIKEREIFDKLNIEKVDLSGLLQNLLDNAIEAAMAVEQEKRYVHVESKFQEGRLLLSIKNSKPSGTSSYQQTSKKDKIKHGRGIRSVRKVAEKYGGELMLKDQGEHFEAVLLLNGVAKLE